MYYKNGDMPLGNKCDGEAFLFNRHRGNLWCDLPTTYEFVIKTYEYN